MERSLKSTTDGARGAEDTDTTMQRLPTVVAEGFLESRQALEAQIKTVSKAMGPLYPRSWSNAEEAMSSSSSSPSSAAASSSSTCASAPLVFMQFNLLAEGLSADPSVTPPFPASKESGFGGFDSVEEPSDVMNFKDVRRWRLLEVITYDNLAHFCT